MWLPSGSSCAFLEFKRSTDRVEGFLEAKEAAANEQQSSIIEVLRAVADKWVVEQINFVVGNCGSAMCTPLDFQQKPTNCVLANDNGPYILPHINLYLSMR